MDMIKMNFENEIFSGIWCMASLSDISKEDSPKSINEFHRVLKHGGVLYIAVKEGNGIGVVKKKKYNNIERTYVYYKQNELEDLLKKKFIILSSNVSDDSGTKWVEIFAKKI